MADTGYNTVIEKFFSHIDRHKRGFPPEYNESVIDKVTLKASIDNNFNVPRNRENVDYFRIGDCVLSIPPEKITVLRQSENNQYVGLRQSDSIKTKAGYRIREVTIDIQFNGLDQINGIPVAGPAGTINYIDGLRPLIAQLKKSPFLPVENAHLNLIHDIYAIVVLGLSVSTVDGYPDLISAKLVGYEFNSQPYITLPSCGFGDIIDYDIYRWHYQRSLIENSKSTSYLPKIAGRIKDDFKFYIAEEGQLADASAQASEKATAVSDRDTLDMIEVIIPDDLFLTSIQIGIGNIIKNIQLSAQACPTVQYFGSTSSMISCTFETTNEDALSIFNWMEDTCERYARQYRNRTVQGYVKFDNQLINMFGIDHVIIDSVKIETVPNFPGTYVVNVLMSSFNSTQNKDNRPNELNPVANKGTVKDLMTADSKDRYRPAMYDQIIENMLANVNIYPDLDLPTYSEYVGTLNNINKWRVENLLGELPYKDYILNNNTGLYNIGWKEATTIYSPNAISKFSDVSVNHWAYEDIVALSNANIIEGLKDGTFMPDVNITRAHVAVILCRALKLPIIKSDTSSFSDINTSDWYFDYVETVCNRGIMNGYTDNSFKPNEDILRGEFVVALCRARSVVVNESTQEVNQYLQDMFHDFADIQEFAKKSVYYATKKEWISGFVDGTFRAKSPITRAQVSRIVSASFGIRKSTTTPTVTGTYYLKNKSLSNTYVDPDFYFFYPTQEQAGITSITDPYIQPSEMKDKLNSNIDKFSKKWTMNTVEPYGNAYKSEFKINPGADSQLSANSSSGYDGFLKELINKESSGSSTLVNQFGYLGKYQMGEAALHWVGFYEEEGDLNVKYQKFDVVSSDDSFPPSLVAGYINTHPGKWTELAKKHGVTSVRTFLNSPAAQDFAIKDYHKKTWAEIESYKLTSSIGKTYHGIKTTASGMLAVAHLVGVGGLIVYLGGPPNKNVKVNSSGIPIDGNGTPATRYMKLLGGYDLTSITGKNLDGDSSSPIVNNKFIFPIKNHSMPTSGNNNGVSITSGYGWRDHPIKKERIWHNGIDIGGDAINSNTIVVAAADGKVIEVAESALNPSGLYIIIDHGNGYKTSYAHLSRYIVSKVGREIKQGQEIGYVGSTGTDKEGKSTSTGNHLHFVVRKSGAVSEGGGDDVEPIPLLEVGATTTTTSSGGKTLSTNMPGIKENPGVDWNKFGKPLSGDAGMHFPNKEEGLVERMYVDMVEYSKRGTMCRAFPSYVLLFVDEGNWMNGYKLWSNYYVYHSIVDITVEKDRRKPADTALVKLINIYNALGRKTKTYNDEEHTWNEKFWEFLGIYSDSAMSKIINNKNILLRGFELKSGARVHIRMGYGSNPDNIPIVFNGTVTEVDTQDVVTIIAQGDGEELTKGLVGIEEEKEINSTWSLGNEPQNIIMNILTKRDRTYLSNITNILLGAKHSANSFYGIEHFGNLFFKTPDGNGDAIRQQIEDMGGALSIADKILSVNPAYTGTMNIIQKQINDRDYASTTDRLLEGFLPEAARQTLYDQYDLCKNIYLAEESGKTDLDKNSDMWSTSSYWSSNWNDGENNLKIYTFNKTPWDLFQVLAAVTPEFICYPHPHQFRSTLFFGMPHWNIRYKYKYNSDDTVTEYAKAYSQMHVLNSLYDVIDNKITAAPPETSVCIGTYGDRNDNRTGTDPVYADKDMKTECQNTSIVDTGIRWGLGASILSDNFIVDYGLRFLADYNPGEEQSRRVAIASIQNSFKDMYGGSLVILGDGSIKPHDKFYLDDFYVGMNGLSGVGRVVIHMGIETGFITDIKPDLCTVQSDVDMTLLKYAPLAISVGASVGLFCTGAIVAGSILDKLAKNIKPETMAGKSFIALTKISRTARVIKKLNGANVVGGLRNIITTIRNAKTVTSLLGIGGAPETLGASIVVAGVALIIFSLIERAFSALLHYLRDKNVIKIYPLWYKNKPYVAGISGHKNLIPGYKDEDFYINYGSDVESEMQKEWLLKKIEDSTLPGTGTGNDKDDLSGGVKKSEEVTDEEVATINRFLRISGGMGALDDERFIDPKTGEVKDIDMTQKNSDTVMKLAQNDPEDPREAFPNAIIPGFKDYVFKDAEGKTIKTYRPIKADTVIRGMGAPNPIADPYTDWHSEYVYIDMSDPLISTIKTNNPNISMKDVANRPQMLDKYMLKAEKENRGKKLKRDAKNQIKLVYDTGYNGPKRYLISVGKDSGISNKIVQFGQLGYKAIITPLPVFAFYDGVVISSRLHVAEANTDSFLVDLFKIFAMDEKDRKIEDEKAMLTNLELDRDRKNMPITRSIIWINHPELNISTIYINVTFPAKGIVAGAKVKAGQVIGQMGIHPTSYGVSRKGTVMQNNPSPGVDKDDLNDKSWYDSWDWWVDGYNETFAKKLGKAYYDKANISKSERYMISKYFSFMMLSNKTTEYVDPKTRTTSLKNEVLWPWYYIDQNKKFTISNYGSNQADGMKKFYQDYIMQGSPGIKEFSEFIHEVGADPIETTKMGAAVQKTTIASVIPRDGGGAA